jgi:hypothetical protein
MPSIINASSTGSGGIVQTADASGVLQLQSNGVTALTVSGANVTVAGTLSTGNSAPQVTTYASGSGTYTTPAGAKYLTVEMSGGGGGGAGAGNTVGPSYGNAGTSGGNSTFGTSLLSCQGGGPGTPAGGASAPGAGGAGSITAPATGVALTGGGGNGVTTGVSGSGILSINGCTGGSNPFGGGGGNGQGNWPMPANTGTGGTGGLADPTKYIGTGGGAGGYVNAIIASPSASYSYAVGAAGAGGAGGSGCFAGNAGSAGIIIVTAYF